MQEILGHGKSATTVNVYMQPIDASVKQTQAAICGADGRAETGSRILKAENLVRFGTVGIGGGPQVIVPQGLGA